ncbi:hypothetical protein BBP40_003479 [Aspergillus hancockii]|nr:hypothetical protein BBP40_003479 [Aspergillus hancockii]
MPVRSSPSEIQGQQEISWDLRNIPRSTDGSPGFEAAVIDTSRCDPAALYSIVIDECATQMNGSKTSRATVFACAATYQHAEAEISIASNTSIVAVNIQPGTTCNLSQATFNIGKFEDYMSARYLATGFRTISDSNALMDVGQYKRDVGDVWKHNFIMTINEIFNPIANPTTVELSTRAPW